MPIFAGGASNIGSAQITDDSIVNNDINSSAAIAYSKLNLADSIEPTDVKDTVIKNIVIDVSSAEILGLSATPKTLIAAPGANKVIVIYTVAFHAIYGGTAYAAGGDLNLRYIGESDALLSAVVDVNILRGTVDRTAIAVPTAVNYSNVLPNEGVELYQEGTAFTTGNGTLKVSIAYRVVDLS